MTEKEIKQMQAEIERLRADNARLQSEMIRLVSRNLELSEQLEVDVELRRRSDVARTLMEENIERQRNADLQDDGQLLALIDLRLEEKRSHLNPGFDTKQLAELLGVSQERLIKLFRNKSIYRTPEAYIDNLRNCSHFRGIGLQPCAHPAASHHGRHRHDTGGLQGPFYKGYVSGISLIQSLK